MLVWLIHLLTSHYILESPFVIKVLRSNIFWLEVWERYGKKVSLINIKYVQWIKLCCFSFTSCLALNTLFSSTLPDSLCITCCLIPNCVLNWSNHPQLHLKSSLPPNSFGFTTTISSLNIGLVIGLVTTT